MSTDGAQPAPVGQPPVPVAQPVGASQVSTASPNTTAASSTAAAAADRPRRKYTAGSVTALFVPISVCMLFVVVSMKIAHCKQPGQTAYIAITPFEHEEHVKDVPWFERFGWALINVLILIGCVVVLTVVIVILYKCRCYKVLKGWMVFSSLVLEYLFTFVYLQELFACHNVPMDYITIAIFIWNFGTVGMISLYWKGPLLLQQFFLILSSGMMALVLINYIPEWTLWIFLGVLCVWDLVAVLCPFGPLRILVHTAQERNEPLFPSLVYNTRALWLLVGSHTDVKQNRTNNNNGNQTGRDPRTPVGIQQFRSSPRNKPRTNSPVVQPPIGQTVTGIFGGSSTPQMRSRFVPAAAANDPPTPTTSNSRPSTPVPPRGSQSPPVAKRHFWNTSPSRTPTPTTTNVASAGSQTPGTPGATGATGGTQAQQRPPVAAAAAAAAEDDDGDDDETGGIKLGLGDFIFYSVLVGKASIADNWIITIACFVAILVGLCFTIMLLIAFDRALPALPISIALGLVFYFVAAEFVASFAEMYSVKQIFI